MALTSVSMPKRGALLSAAVVLASVGALGAGACDTPAPAPSYVPPPAPAVDCVGVLHVAKERGSPVANVRRFGRERPELRLTARIGELADADLRAFCDWESCIRTNGYPHTCWVNDAGFERCRMCDGGGDCDGHPISQDACVAAASARSQCHVGLLQECAIQWAMRGPADPRVTQTCKASLDACAGKLPGDLTQAALAAQLETDQVTVEVCRNELAISEILTPGSPLIPMRRASLDAWEGGLPPDALDAGAGDAPQD